MGSVAKYVEEYMDAEMKTFRLSVNLQVQAFIQIDGKIGETTKTEIKMNEESQQKRYMRGRWDGIKDSAKKMNQVRMKIDEDEHSAVTEWQGQWHTT